MKSKLLVVAVVFFLVGAFAGFLWAGARFKHSKDSKELEFSKARDCAVAAGTAAYTLKQLRLNQITNAIEDLEMHMDSLVSSLATTDQYRDRKTRVECDRWLKSVKAYHKDYPVKTEDAATVEALLAQIPDQNPSTMPNASPR